MTAVSTWLPWFLQCGDTQFPSGSYAHSVGLEGLVQLGVVRTADDLRENLLCQVIPTLLHFDLPMLARSHGYAGQGDLEALIAQDEELEAWRLAAELREASRKVGSRRLHLCARLDPEPLVLDYSARPSPKHLLVVTGVEHRRAPLVVVAMSLVWQTLHAAGSAALKLIRMGQERCHAILHEAMASAAPMIEAALARRAEETGWFDPLTEIASLRHARARERLFIS